MPTAALVDDADTRERSRTNGRGKSRHLVQLGLSKQIELGPAVERGRCRPSLRGEAHALAGTTRSALAKLCARAFGRRARAMPLNLRGPRSSCESSGSSANVRAAGLVRRLQTAVLMSLARSSRPLLASIASLLAVVAISDRAAAISKGEVDPDPPRGKVPPAPPPPKPPIGLPTCTAPTLAMCQDPSYIDSYCGFVNRNACGELVLPIYQAEVRGRTETTTILKGTSEGLDTLQVAKKLDPIPMPEAKLTFGTLSFATAVQLGRTKPPFAATANLDPQHPVYESNGAAVASCQEYAYESLYDHERFVESAETCGSNAECVYQLSLRTTTPGLKTTMLKKNGTPMAWQTVRPGAFSQLKNHFFANGAAILTVGVMELRQHPDYSTSAQFRAKAEAIITHVMGTPKATASSELAWHRNMHDAFIASPVSSAELAGIRQRLSSYGDATSDTAIGKLGAGLLEGQIPGLEGQARADAIALAAEYRAQRDQGLRDMARLLFAEWDRVSPTTGLVDHGCLDRASVKCDWSPARFVARYGNHHRGLSEQLFSQCITATGGNFSRVPAAYRVDTDALATWIAAQAVPKLGTEIVGERFNDGDEWGDRDWFAAGYSYDAGWQLAAQRQPSTQRICKLKGNAYAQASANVWALGEAVPILDTRHKLSVRETGDALTFHSHLRVVGEDVYSPVDYNVVLPSATPVDKSTTKTLAQRTYTKWLSIAGVGVKLQAKAEIKAGAELKAKATAASGCNPDNLAYDASISVRPWLNTHVVPEVSVGVVVIQAGVRGDVELMKVSAPATAGVKLVGGVNDITLQMRANANVELDMLKGHIDVFLESCLPWVGCADLASKQIYAWDGYSWTFPLFAYNKDLSIGVFDAATTPTSNTNPLFPPMNATF
jgi:hypothetical protein